MHNGGRKSQIYYDEFTLESYCTVNEGNQLKQLKVEKQGQRVLVQR